MLENELRDLLRELTESIGALSASVVHVRSAAEAREIEDGEARRPPVHEVLVAALGSGAFLRVVVPAQPSERSGDDGEGERARAIEQCSRALRACTRRWNEPRVPVVTLNASSIPVRERVEVRIAEFLKALANTQHALNAVVAVHGKVVASASTLAADEGASIPFTQRRLAVEASRRQRSHAELVGEDYYAVSFWYGACLLVFFSKPYAVDFIRHRARLVTRELSSLLPLLDDPPPSGAQVAPHPE
ncbi:MAG: hypothetical protein AAGC55_00775 [Myxococcota bacterium]